MQIHRGVFLMLLIIFIFFKPAGNSPHLSTPEEVAQLKEYFQLQRHEIEMLKNSTWQDAPIGLTGVELNPNTGSLLPQEILDMAQKLWFSDLSSLKGLNLERKPLSIGSLSSLTDAEYNSFVYYNNISGIYEGRWDRSTISDRLIPANMTVPTQLISKHNSPLLPHLKAYSRGDISDETGKVSVTVREIPSRNHQSANVTLLDMTVTFSDDAENSEFTVKMQGFHIKSTGNLVMSTESLKFSGMHLLPHLVLDQQHFTESQKLMMRYLNGSIHYMEADMSFDFFHEIEQEALQCEYIVYGHMHPAPLNQWEMHEMELELQHPLGRPIRKIPELEFSALFYSPDCAFCLKSDQIIGEKYETFSVRLRVVVVASVVLFFAQMVLLAIQMKDTSTPSLLSKVSFYSMGLLALVDGSAWIASFVFSFVEGLTLPFTVVSFLWFGLASRYMVKIYQSQGPEQLADARVRQVIQSSTRNGRGALFALADGTFLGNSTNTSAGSEGLLPLPATAPNQPPTSSLDQSERAISRLIYSRLYVLQVIFLIVSLITTSWPLKYRLMYEYVVVIFMYSIWVPQIYRNTSRGYRKSFLWSFILGTSFIRLLPLLYLCLYTKNIINHHYDPTLVILTIAWMGLQIGFLVAQTVFGARFFLPKGFLPVLYDYHPVLYQGDSETDFGIDLVATAGQQLPGQAQRSKSFGFASAAAMLASSSPFKKKKLKDDHDDGFPLFDPSSHSKDSHSDKVLRPNVDCAICMMPVELIIIPRSMAAITSSPAMMLARRRYMVTPCQHVFHTECMDQWMRSRLQCPICRNPLPPL